MLGLHRNGNVRIQLAVDYFALYSYLCTDPLSLIGAVGGPGLSE